MILPTAILCCLAFVEAPETWNEAQSQQSVRDGWAVMLDGAQLSNRNYGPYCGIFASCRALELEGIRPKLKSHFTTEYVSSPQGSTPADLVRLIEFEGGTATPLANMSKLEVMLVGKPVIANVRSSPFSASYDHWVCVIYDDGSFLVFDGPNKPVRVSPAQFLSNWSGYGIVVSRSRNAAVTRSCTMRVLVSLLLVAGVAIVSVYCIKRIRTPLAKYFVGLSVSTVLLGASFQIVFGDFSDYGAGIQSATTPFAGKTSLRVVGFEECVAASKDESAVIIDARPPEAFEAGTIPNAINIPADSSILVLDALLEDANRQTSIIVFCQSAECSWDEQVAHMLTQLGFENTSVSRIGWNEYVAREKD